MLSRKSDWSGGSSSFLHSLLSRLDFNQFISQQAATLGLAKQTQIVPNAMGTVTSPAIIQKSMRRTGKEARKTEENGRETAVLVSPRRPPTSSSSSARPPMQLAPPDFSSPYSYSISHSQAAAFASGNTRTTATASAGSHHTLNAAGSNGTAGLQLSPPRSSNYR